MKHMINYCNSYAPPPQISTLTTFFLISSKLVILPSKLVKKFKFLQLPLVVCQMFCRDKINKTYEKSLALLIAVLPDR